MEMNQAAHIIFECAIFTSFFLTTTWRPSGRGSQRKGKAVVPKPARGSGLNPSGLPVADQLNLPAERPQMSAFDFDPYEQTVPGWPGALQQAYDDTQGQSSYGSFEGGQEQGPSFYSQGLSSFGDGQEQGPSFYSQGATSFGDAQGPLSFGDGQEQGSSSFGDGQEQGPLFYSQGATLFGDAQGPLSFGNMQEQEQQFCGDSQGASSHTDGQDYYNVRDAPLDAGPSNYRQGIAPVSRWVEGAPDGGISIVDRGDGLIPPASDLSMIRRREIPTSEVVHYARTTTTCTLRHTNMPATPYVAPQTATIATGVQEPSLVAEPHDTPSDSGHGTTKSLPKNRIRLTPEVIKQTLNGAKGRVPRLVFSKHAMTCSRKRKKRFINEIIQESVPNFFRPDAVFEEFITNAHRKTVGNTLSVTRGKMVDFAREGVCDAFQLFPPRGHSLPPGRYRTTRINRFINGPDPLLFMHDFYFDENDNIIVITKFQNRFIMSNVIRFIWYWGYASFLGDSPLKSIKYIMAVSGAATHCSLHEQGREGLNVDPFSGQFHQAKFEEILRAIDNLTPAEKAEFEQYLQYILDIGPSQTRDNSSSSSDLD
ncbi:uncharacterized protein EDB93DRAFT_1107365 [Suillus bovinus]|uniref:uncharacterized protein n=1 Tax=Suillus bovinus TaxID=48563 RepID=UPI001B86ACE7|nr:uncharacterized protein EDB93DRAFT_1107365 [Suillus bovinus]KAG2134159.1 hypothetical protein EDB93DRAFT_1107365 [Suillus bovinus]